MDPPALADERSLAVLDFPVIRALLARRTMTARGAALAETLVPGADLEQIRAEQSATSEMRAIVTAMAFDLPRVAACEQAVERAARGAALTAEELRAIAVALAAAAAAVTRVRATDAPTLAARCAGATPQAAVVRRIDVAIGDRGEVLDRASPALGRLRRNLANAQADARDRCQAMIRSAKFAKAIQDGIVTVRDGRFVIPVKADFAGSIPGVVHDTSASGQTLFIEPLAALEVNNRVQTLRLEVEREIVRILANLSSLVGEHAVQIETNLAILASLDLSLARVRLAEAMRATAPTIASEPRVVIRDGRHPLLGERAIPQSLALEDDVHFIVISGPNMGGKTVTLKMLGLFVAMTYCGLQLPAADGTTIGCFTWLGCDIGDEQSIAQNASTFSAHLARLRTIVDRTSNTSTRALVLVDEIASGTEPAAGAALGIAVLERLLASGTYGIVTTHATELKLFAQTTPGIRNANVRFDPQTHAPTYELDIGAPGQSLAFPLARAMGLDDAVVVRGESLLSASERNYEQVLAELTRLRAQLTTELEQLGAQRRHLTSLEANARRRTEALERERRAFAKDAAERLGQALRDFARELERRGDDRVARASRVTPGQAALLGRVLDDVHRDLGIDPRPEKRREAAGLAVGDRVMVETLGTAGTIADDYGDSALVTIGAMRTVVAKTHLQLIEKGAVRVPPRVQPGETTLDAAAGARHELDVRGKRYAEAEPVVDAWLDEARLLGVSPLRLIHGKGTGLLGRGLQQYLKTLDGVRDVRYGDPTEGGAGVTVFELE